METYIHAQKSLKRGLKRSLNKNLKKGSDKDKSYSGTLIKKS